MEIQAPKQHEQKTINYRLLKKKQTRKQRRQRQRQSQQDRATSQQPPIQIIAGVKDDSGEQGMLGKRMAVVGDAEQNRDSPTKVRDQKAVDKKQQQILNLSPALKKPMHASTNKDKKFVQNIDKFIQADEFHFKWQELMAEQPEDAKRISMLLEKAKIIANFPDQPRLYQKLVDKTGQPRIGQLDVAPWERNPQALSAKLVRANHLFGMGVVKYTGSNMSVYNLNALRSFFEQIHAMFGSPLRDQYTVHEMMSDLVFRKKLRIELALSHILAIPCQAHFFLRGHAYQNFIVSTSRRAVSEQFFLLKEHIDKKFGEWVQDEDLGKRFWKAYAKSCAADLQIARLNALQDHTDFEERKQDTSEEPATIDIDNHRWPVLHGFIFKHPQVPNRSITTCYEETRKNAHLSESTIALNQALGCNTLLQLQRGGIASTSELLMMLRLQKPHLFVDDQVFTQLAVLAHCQPFSLDMNIFGSSWIGSRGKYEENKLFSHIAEVTAGLQLTKVLRMNVDKQNQTLDVCYNTIKTFFEAFHQFLSNEAKESFASQGPKSEANMINSNFLKQKPILQVNFRSSTGERYPLVTNVRYNRHSMKDIFLELRTQIQNTELISKEDIKEIAEPRCLSWQEQDQNDYIIAQEFSKPVLERHNDYRRWNNIKPFVKPNHKLHITRVEQLQDLQQRFIHHEKWQQCGYAKFIAALVVNMIDPSHYGYDMSTEKGKQNFEDFLMSLEIESWELFVVTSEPMEKDSAAYKDLLQFVALKSALSNEMCSHQDLTNPNKSPGLCFGLLCEDIKLFSKSIYGPDAKLQSLRKNIDVERPQKSDKYPAKDYDHRAFTVANLDKHAQLLSKKQAQTFINAYINSREDIILDLGESKPKIRDDAEVEKRQQEFKDQLVQVKSSATLSTDVQSLKPDQQKNLVEEQTDADNGQMRLLSQKITLDMFDPTTHTQTLNMEQKISLQKSAVQLPDKMKEKPYAESLLAILTAAARLPGFVHESAKFVNIHAAIGNLVNQELGPVLRPVYHRVHAWFFSGYNKREMRHLPRYWDTVMQNEAVNYGMIAPESFQLKVIQANRANKNTPEKAIENCFVPIKPLLHQSATTFEIYLEETGWKTDLTTVDIDQNQLFKLFDVCLAILACWYGQFKAAVYHLETFKQVVAQHDYVFVNFLRFVGIEFVCPNIENPKQSLKTYRQTCYGQKQKHKHFQVINNYCLSEKGIEEFAQREKIHFSRNLLDCRADIKAAIIRTINEEPVKKNKPDIKVASNDLQNVQLHTPEKKLSNCLEVKMDYSASTQFLTPSEGLFRQTPGDVNQLIRQNNDTQILESQIDAQDKPKFDHDAVMNMLDEMSKSQETLAPIAGKRFTRYQLAQINRIIEESKNETPDGAKKEKGLPQQAAPLTDFGWTPHDGESAKILPQQQAHETPGRPDSNISQVSDWSLTQAKSKSKSRNRVRKNRTKVIR